MFLRTETSREIKIVGQRLTMSFVENTTAQLFRSFMPRRNEVLNRTSSDLLCVQIYPPKFFQNFRPDRPFEKWAGVEVSAFENIPAEMETIVVPSGLYAVFLFKGTMAKAGSFFEQVYGNWFASSGYRIDSRPHIDVIGSKYKHNDPESEEEIWIPVTT